ncbi:MAG TPA: Ig-like domain-containing protein, partial [Promineifilum sp.]|nr:Ig-like domain-containing protein [Promineifilum sp.]
FVLGDSGVAEVDLRLANGTLRDGPDAIAIYTAPMNVFPNDAPVSVENLLDAVVYGSADERLLVLLNAGQDALDENSRGAATTDSNQRCPNGGGRPRETEAFIQNSPTPGESNRCRFDDPPQVDDVVPKPGAVDVALDTSLAVTFSEPVSLTGQPFEIVCTATGIHAYDVAGGPETFAITLHEPLTYGETCVNTVWADEVRDLDSDDPPDTLAAKYTWTFQTVKWVAENVVINEIDADTLGVDAAEFIELFDGGVGGTSLDGLNIVFFNGADDLSYLTINLNGRQTNQAGYFVLGNESVNGVGITFPNGALQNGPDAVALVTGAATDWPNGTAITGVIPLDALVYGRPTQVAGGLMPLLNAGQPQVDEAGRGDVEAHSNQRCPNGAGGARNTTGYKQNTPTPGATNDCATDTAPNVIDFSPARDAQGVASTTAIVVEFDEPVSVTGKWMTVKCVTSGTHTYNTTGGPIEFVVTPTEPFAYDETCTVTVNPDLVTDQDTDDPPDKLAKKVSWSFVTGGEPADFVLINEIDADTPGTDTAEFIELYDGGRGLTALDGLLIVLYNGSNNLLYQTIDLGGFSTDEQGYFVLGDTAVTPDLVLANGFLQNGPDAVALFIGGADQFPNNSPITLQGLLDAGVYGASEAVSQDLLRLLEAGQEAADENGRGAADTHSLQRCPDGSGGQRRMDSYAPNTPTPGVPNRCEIDLFPTIISTIPAVGATGVSVYASINLTFSEAVDVASGSIRLECGTQGDLSVAISGGPLSYTVSPAAPMPQEATCRLTVVATGVSDQDDDDPPDKMAEDYQLEFTTGHVGADFVIINEMDADTPGSDKAEFIELFDGGRGNTSLSGLLIVLYNGGDDRSYRMVNLTGLKTDSDGFAVIGNKDVAGVGMELPVGFLQNGADAVALYAGGPDSFPNGTAVHTQGLIDALVYGTDDPADKG